MNYNFTIKKFFIEGKEYHVRCMFNESERKFYLSVKLTEGESLKGLHARISRAYMKPKSLIDHYTYWPEVHEQIKEAFDHEIVKLMMEVI